MDFRTVHTPFPSGTPYSAPFFKRKNTGEGPPTPTHRFVSICWFQSFATHRHRLRKIFHQNKPQVPNPCPFQQKTGVSKNSGSPKSSILIGCSIINHPFWDTLIFGNIQTMAGLMHHQGALTFHVKTMRWPTDLGRPEPVSCNWVRSSC